MSAYPQDHPSATGRSHRRNSVSSKDETSGAGRKSRSNSHSSVQPQDKEMISAVATMRFKEKFGPRDAQVRVLRKKERWIALVAISNPANKEAMEDIVMNFSDSDLDKLEEKVDAGIKEAEANYSPESQTPVSSRQSLASLYDDDDTDFGTISRTSSDQSGRGLLSSQRKEGRGSHRSKCTMS